MAPHTILSANHPLPRLLINQLCICHGRCCFIPSCFRDRYSSQGSVGRLESRPPCSFTAPTKGHGTISEPSTEAQEDALALAHNPKLNATNKLPCNTQFPWKPTAMSKSSCSLACNPCVCKKERSVVRRKTQPPLWICPAGDTITAASIRCMGCFARRLLS